MSETGKRIAELRKARGLTQKDLALRLKPKTSDVQISRLESEDRRLTLNWLVRIATAMELKVSDLLPDEHYAPRETAGAGGRLFVKIVIEVHTDETAV